MYYLLSHGQHPVLDKAFSLTNEDLSRYKERLQNLENKDINLSPLTNGHYSEK